MKALCLRLFPTTQEMRGKSHISLIFCPIISGRTLPRIIVKSNVLGVLLDHSFLQYRDTILRKEISVLEMLGWRASAR